MKAITVSTVGGPDVLRISNVPEPHPEANQILVKVEASALNRADLLQRRGVYPAPEGESPILGLEIAGEIVNRGSDVHHFELGQRVFGLVAGGGYSEYCCMDEGLAIKIPHKWSVVEAASIPEVFFTAQEALMTCARLQPGETILIHAGASGVGTAAIQMAKHLGATVYFTASSQEKIDAVCALGAHSGFQYDKETFLSSVMALTDGQGVDVIIDILGAEAFRDHMTLLKEGGRLVQLAYMTGQTTDLDFKVLVRKRIQLIGTMLRYRSLKDKREICRRFTEHWLPLLVDGQMHPVIDKVFPFMDVQKAHLRMEARQNIGKIILTW